MNTALLKQLGNMAQVAGIRESQLLRGRGEHIQIAEVYNAAGLHFTVVPDRCMDLFDFSYKGINLSFQTKNGLTSPQAFDPGPSAFAEQWSGGMLVTCGLDNVGAHASIDGEFPTHGRISHMPAQNFGVETRWEGGDYVLRTRGEVHQSKMYSRHLSLRRTIETTLYGKSVNIHDTITNFTEMDEPYLLLYHFNFGYPLLREGTKVAASKADLSPVNSLSVDFSNMTAPVDGKPAEAFFRTNLEGQACGVVYNEELELGAYVSFDTKNLPNMVQWKLMKSHDYVLALEPCNTFPGLNRADAIAQGKAAILPAYSCVENHLELGVLDGLGEIREFLKNL